jgi:fatty-acyl-CoA synthase
MADAGSAVTLPYLIARHAQTRGDDIAFHFEGRDTSYRELDRRANQVANGLIAAGLPPGARIAFLGKNSDHFFELMIGAARAGMVITPVNWRLAPPEVAWIIQDAEAPALFVGSEFTAIARQVAAGQPALRLIVTMEGGAEDWPSYVAWRDAQGDAPCNVAIDETTVAMQLYTSGTTGHPKGAMLTHRNFLDLRNEQKYGETPAWNRWRDSDVSLLVMPVFHIAGSGWGVFALYYGAKTVVMREFDPAGVLEAIVAHKVSKLFLVPAAMQFVVRLPRARQIDYSRLKYILYGASPIPAALLRECMEVFGCGFVQLYGMTETTGMLTVLAPEDHTTEDRPHMRSAGKPLPGIEVAILDAEGRHLPPGQTGEIATRSEAVMAGYWKLPEASARTIGSDGWLRTGDAGMIDADGFVYVQDRIKDMIISGGENIYPAEVESALFGHPAIAEVAVIGVPDEKWGEAVKAMVVLRPGASATAQELMDYARQRIAGYKVPKSIDFIPAMPRNATGKILRRQLRDPYWAGRERQVN